MFKSLPPFEKEFKMSAVDKATPDWLKIVMLVFVILLFIGFSIADAGDICTLPENSDILMMEGDTLHQITNDIPGEMVVRDKQPDEEALSVLTKYLKEDWSDGVSVWDEAYNNLIVHKADLVDCLSDNKLLIIPAE